MALASDWQGGGLTPRIDAHVHAFPDRLAGAVRDALNRGGMLRSGFLLHEIAALVRDEGFDAAWILPYAHRGGVAESVNEWSAAECPAYPWLVAGATFHPEDEDFERLVERALVDLRLRLVKLHCAVGNFSVTDARLEPLWQVAGRLGVPVLVHAGRRAPALTDTDEIDSVATVLRAHPDLRLVLAHTGHPYTERALALMAGFANLYADVTPVWETAVEAGRDALEQFAGRFLFGSDAPNNPAHRREQTAGFARLGLGAEALALLLGGAAARLVPPD